MGYVPPPPPKPPEWTNPGIAVSEGSILQDFINIGKWLKKTWDRLP